ncbi:MAG: CHAT domain-containing protein, partial [Candidatus Brocadiae bacterium]|nr:CHAT domain-containing protein [Candidatus Brocadiia bacterium]
FKAMSQEAHWLHLSTHGFFLESEDSKEEKNILDSFTERRLVLKQGTHPLLLSGIVLAGANLPKPQEINMDDGYLTAQEIATLDLSKVHCAVFSCCDTGLGKSELATGFSGLKTALAAAGVNHSIITLWNVLEQQSGNQLSLFYSYVFQYKMPVTQAINKTQRSTLLISKFRHPCLWASFLCYSNSIQPQ